MSWIFEYLGITASLDEVLDEEDRGALFEQNRCNSRAGVVETPGETRSVGGGSWPAATSPRPPRAEPRADRCVPLGCAVSLRDAGSGADWIRQGRLPPLRHALHPRSHGTGCRRQPAPGTGVEADSP